LGPSDFFLSKTAETHPSINFSASQKPGQVLNQCESKLVTLILQAPEKGKFKTSRGGGGRDSGGGTDGEEAGEATGRLERVTIAAAKQSLRVHAMELHAPTRLADVAAMVKASELSLVAVAGAPSLRWVHCFPLFFPH
jgi:hypothetical protein